VLPASCRKMYRVAGIPKLGIPMPPELHCSLPFQAGEYSQDKNMGPFRITAEFVDSLIHIAVMSIIVLVVFKGKQ
jgi:hypothetical protein